MKKKKLIYLGCLLFIASLLLFNPDNGGRNSGDPVISEKESDRHETFNRLLSADGVTSYSSNNFFIIDEDFNDLEDWSDPDEGYAESESNQLVMYGEDEMGQDTQDEDIYVEYSNSIPPFIKGKISFEYSIEEDSDTHTLRFQVSTDEGDNWNTLFNKTSGSGSQEINLEERGYSDEENFEIRFYFKAEGRDDKAYVDYFKLSTYEFSWTETNGDRVNPTSNQNISLYVCPNFTNFWSNFDETNVTLFYKINSEDMSSPDGSINSSQTSNNFSLIIPEENYYQNDVIYYQIWINNDGQDVYHKTPIKSFKCYEDNTPPNIQNLDGNYTSVIYYKNDIKVTCDITDNYELKEAVMYIANGTTPSISNVHIEPEQTPVPEGGGSFEFIIPSNYTTARESLNFMINATDYGNNQITEEDSVTIRDNTEPFINFMGDSSNAGGSIDSNESLEVQYKITEPLEGIGLDNATLYVRVASDFPENDEDYNFTVNPDTEITIDGGLINFTIPYQNYAYGKNICYWVKAEDVSGNINSTFSDLQSIEIVDNNYPMVTIDSSNFDPCSYEEDKILTFDIFEPPGGCGLKNGSVHLRYGLNNDLTDARVIQINITKYGRTVQFQINASEMVWKYRDSIYFQLNASDIENNVYNSPILNFNITDLVSPEYNENLTLNTNGWVYDNYKLMNFTVEDPDFDDANLSSGIDSIQLYYNPGEEPSATDYRGVRLQPTVIKERETYTFNLTLNESMFQTSPIIYYRINVTDVAGNTLLTEAKTFQLYSEPYIITSEDLLDEVIGSTTFTIDFDLNFHCDVSYTIYQDEEFYAEDSLNYINQFHRQFDLPEDTYDIVFNFSGTGHTYKFSTELDVTPPEPIQSLELTVYGSEVVKLNWETPSGADPVTVYKIYRSTEADFNPLEGTLIATIQPGEELRYEDNTIEPGKTYYYKVISLDRVNNMQTKSVQVEASIPTSPVPIIITFIVIGAIAGAGGFIAYQKITTKKREKMFSEVDLSELDLEEDFDSEMVVEDKMEKWDTIQTKAKAKPAPKPVKTEAGFEFSEGEGKRVPELPAGTYWTQEVKRLLNRAVDYELKGKYGKTLKLYTMVRRIAKQMENDELLHKMQGKIGSLHRDIA